MQIGLYLSGEKAEVLAIVDKKAEKEKKRFARECEGNQVFIEWEDPETRRTPIHRACPIKNETSVALIDKAVEHLKEQLADLKDDDECSFAFQLTIQRRNYR